MTATGANAIDFYCEHACAQLVPEDQATLIAEAACADIHRRTGFRPTVAFVDREEVTTALQLFLRLDVLPADDQIIGSLAEAVRDDLYRRTGLDFAVSASYDTYAVLAAPGIAFVAPDTGDALGGETVSVQGARLDTASSVLFGVTSASFVVVDSTELTVTTPAHAAGAVSVTVVNAAGTTVLPAAFTYA